MFKNKTWEDHVQKRPLAKKNIDGVLPALAKDGEDILLQLLRLLILQHSRALQQGGSAALACHELGCVGLGDLQVPPLHWGWP